MMSVVMAAQVVIPRGIPVSLPDAVAVPKLPPPPRPVLAEDGSVLPTAAAKAAAKAHGPVQEGPMCVICQMPLRASEERESLWCSHTFHRACVVEWRVCSNKGPQDCPFRCIMPASAVPL